MSQIIAQEHVGTGGMGLSFYARYLSSMRNILWVGPLLLILIVAENFFANGFRWLVSLWVEGCPNEICQQGVLFESSVRLHFVNVSQQRGLATLFFFVVVAIVFRAVTWTFVTSFFARGGRSMHDDVVDSLSNVPVSFYDQNPTGRIVRRFSGDYSSLLIDIPNYVNDVFGCIAEIVWIFILVAFQAPLACVSTLPCAFVYVRTQALFRPASREVQRLAKVLETPIWSVFTECVSGLQTIRAYGRAGEFQARLRALQDRYAYAFMTQNRLTRWLNVRLKITSELFGLVVTLFVIAALASGRMGPGVAGFLMSLSIGLDGTMQWLTRTFSMIDSTMVSFERILEYRQLPRESDERRLAVDGQERMGQASERHARSGALVFHQLSARYRTELPLALRSVSVTIPHAARVGIIGRTGAGKSTLFQALFQMLEIESGDIRYAGESLREMQLEDARSLFAIVPQEPHLFAGSLRHNLDRLGKHSDDRLWQVLDAVRLSDDVARRFGSGLDFHVAEKGQNLSVGQRQLLCFARALLLDAPIVLMDEPTASVDLETDAAIQAAVKTLFRDKTMLVIAHRLETVQDCDMVLVMEHGSLVAQGRPEDILRQWGARAELASMLE
jgi:ABC-type multidrug transport system fused ATPase/permease subunit